LITECINEKNAKLTQMGSEGVKRFSTPWP